MYKVHVIAYCVKKGNLHFSHVIEDGLLEKYSIIIQKNQNSKFFTKIFARPKKRFSGNFLSKRQVGRVLA